MQLWKRRGTTNSLSHIERREGDLVAHIERGIDDRTRSGGLIEEIIAECRARTLTQPEDASWRFLLGRCLMAVGEPMEARDELEAAAVLAPRDPRVSAHLAFWYEAASLAAAGGHANVELPAGAGPELTVRLSAFLDIQESLSPAALATRATAFIDATLRFALRGRDVAMLKHRRQSLMVSPIDVPAPAALTLVPNSRAG